MSFSVRMADGNIFDIGYKIQYKIIKDNSYNIVYSIDEILQSYIAYKMALQQCNKRLYDPVHLKEIILSETRSHLNENDISVELLEVTVTPCK